MQTYAQRYNSSLVAQGSRISVNSDTSVPNTNPDISMNSTGEFVISWQKDLGSGSLHIQGKRYDASGTPLGSEFQVDTSGATSHTESAVALSDQRHFAFSWSATADIISRLYADRADLVINKTSSVPAYPSASGVYVPGSPIRYTITVTNSGPSPVVGATVTDTFTAAHTGVTWTCVASGTASCVSGSPSGTGASGSNNINQSVDVGTGTLTFTANANTSASATANLTNTATVAVPSTTTEVNSANNSSSLDLPAQNHVDVGVTKTAPAGTYHPGDGVTYTITVTAAGPSVVPPITVTDTFNAALTGVTWTCVANGTASCVSGSPSGTGSSGSGNLSTSVDVSAGGGNSVVYTVTATISSTITATSIDNTASVSPSTGIDDVSANNSSLKTITVAPPTHLTFAQQPTNTNAGSSITPAVTVELRDAGNNLVTGATNTVTLAIGTNPGGGTLSGTTSVAAVNGVATFSGLSINNAGVGYTLVASATSLTGATSSTFNITAAAPPTQLAFVQQPTNTNAGASITPAITVEIRDASNALVSTATNTVTLNISTNPSGGTLSGTTSVAAINGVATFSGLSINNAGNGYVLTASSPGLTNADSSAFNILQVPTQLVFVQQPTNTTAGASITPAITVEIRDASNTVVTGATNTVALSISTNPSGGTLSGTTSVAAVNGVATFSGLSINNAGNGYVLTATSPGLTNGVSSAFNILPADTGTLIDRTNPALGITDDVTIVAEGETVGDRFAFSLTHHPSANVTVTFSSTNAAQLQIIDPTQRGGYFPVNSYTVTFSASGASGAHTVPWNSPVAISLYGVPDGVAEAPTVYGVHFSFVSSDPAYGGLSIPDEPVTVYDAGVTITPTSFSLNEGTSSSYTVVLNAPPGFMALPSGNRTEIVTVTLGGYSPNLSVSPAALVFTRANWNVPQTVTVTSIDDGMTTGDFIVGITHAVSSDIVLNKNMDSPYGGPSSPAPNVTAPTVMVTVIDAGGVPPPAPPPSAGEVPPVQFTPPDEVPPTQNTSTGTS